jgi:hypothetical protein
MRRFRPESFLTITYFLDRISLTKKPAETLLSKDQRRKWRKGFSVLERICSDMGFVTSVLTIQRIREILLETDCTYGRLRQPFRELHGRLTDESKANVFLSVPTDKKNYFLGRHLFGQTVTVNFPSAIADIEEAGKCLALSRATATVFHLMRVMETGLRSLGATLNDSRLDPKQNPNWQKILDRCNEELSKPPAQRSPEWAANGEFFAKVTAHLTAVKNAWRNPTMHVEASYDEQEALDIWNHVGAFMRTLATKLRE